MATEVGSDIALIQDEDMLRKMWQQTEDFGKKKEIRMRMYKLREQRLKEFYTTGEMIQTETTTKRSSTRTHTESITDQGFMSMKTKEIRDSESPTEDYQRQSNTNKNCYVSSKIDESDGNRGIVEIEQTSSLKPTEEYTQDSLQTSMSSSASSMWKSSQTTISVSEEVKKADVNLNSKFIVNEQTNEDRQLTFDTSYNKSDGSNIDSKVTESISTTNIDNIKRDDINQYSNDHQKVIETYTSNNELVEPVSENISNKDSDFIEKTYTSNISKNNSENVEIVTDSKIINELHKLDSYLSTQQSTTDSTKSNSIVSNDDKIIKKVDDQVINTSKENIEDQYITTHQHSYQPPRISVDLSPSHEAFARSLRSTPERSSPSPCRERTSPERRFKSASPEKYRASPEKSGSPARSLNYSTRRKLSSTHTKGLSKKRSITPTRGKQYDSSDDSDCSGATHGTYDKYKSSDAKRTLFKEETKITSVSKYGQKSSSTSPVRREKSPGYSSEGSVGKEVRKSSSKVKNSSHESSPERSAFKPVNNYKTPQTQQITKDNKINRITHEENLYTNNYDSKNKISDDKHLIKVIKPEIDNDLNENECTETATKNTENNILDSKNKSIQEKFIIEEQVCTSSEQINNKKITTQPINNEKNKTPREKSPPKSVKKENKTKQDEFIEKEKSNLAKQSTFTNDDVTIKPKEKSPVKEVKPVTKDDKTYSTVKSTTNVSHASDIKYITPSKKTISAIPSSIPSSIKKVVPSTLEKTPSKKSLIHKDVKDGSSNKTVKKDLSREKMDIKITRNDSKTLIHKNSKDRITPKTVIKKPSQELLVDKKTTISSRQKITSPETKPKIQETIKVLEKKDSKNKLKPSISPQSSQKKLGAVKSTTETKTVIDSKRTIGNINTKKIPSSNGTKPRTSNTPKSNINETPSKITKPFTKTISTSSITKPQIKKTTYSNFNKTIKVEITNNVEQKSKDLEDELPPDNFESDTDLDDSTTKPKYIKNISSNSSTSSSSSEEDDKDEEDVQKIQDIDNIRNEAEQEYGKKMTNKDALLNVIVQLPPSSRESSPEYSARFGQPYCSVSDDASLPRYADVVSEPEDVNDYSNLQSNRYDVVTDLDEESSITVADRVSKFLNNVNKQEEIQKTTEIPQSPQAVRKTKQIFESIAKGKNEEIDIINDVIESETLNIETEENRDLTKINKTPTSLLTRKISGASDYKSRKDFFENKKSNDISEKVTHLTPTKITRSSSIKERRASFETKIDKKTPLKDKTNVRRTKSPESKNSSPDRATKTPIKISKNETFDVKVEEINRSRKLSGSKTVKDRTATFEKNEPTQKSYKENKTTYRHQVPSTPLNTSKISETRIKSTTVTDTKTADRVSTKRVSSPEKTTATDSITKTNEVTNRKISSKSPDRKILETPKKNSTTKSPERSVLINTKDNTTSGNQSARETSFSSSRQRATVTTAKTDFGTTVKNISAPKTTSTTTTTTKSISVNSNDEEVEIEEIFDLHILEIMLEKAVGYDRRRRIRAQIRVVKRQLETNNGLSINTTTRVPKNFQDVLSAKKQNQTNKTVQKTEYVKEAEVKKERSVSPQKSYANPIGNSRSPSPQKTLKSVAETRTPLPTQKTIRAIEKERSLSPQKTVTPIDKVRSPSPQKSTPTEKVRSPSPKKMIVVQQQQDSRFNNNEKSSRNSTITSTSTSSTTVTKTTKVKSDQVSSGTNLYQEQNVTDLITSSYGVGPTDDNGRPLFGLRALRKNNANQSSVSENDSLSSSARYETDSRDTRVSEQKHKSFGLKALQSENTYTVQESTNTTVYQTTSEQKGGVDQLITDHKGKPLFGLRALQSIGKNEEEPIYDDMPEPPVSPQLKDLVLKHEKHAKESSKLDSQPRQKPKAKFRDSFILDTKDEGLYSTFEENGFTDSNQITPLRSINKKTEDDQNNETIVKSKSQSTVFQSKSVMRSDGSGNVSVTQDFLKGELSSVNDQEPSGKLTRGHYTYQSPDNSDAKKGIAKVTTVTTAIGKNTGPQITEITEELNDSDRVDGNKVVKRSRTNDKFENIQKRFSQESFNQDSRRSSKEFNGHEKTEESPQSTPRSSLVRGDSIKALQHKFQQATVSSSLKQNRTAKSDCSRQVEEKTITTKVNATKNSGNATSFLDNNSRVTGVQDVLTRMRNADLVVESGDTNEDTEARALLNKFLGASVILHGMEQGNKSPASVTTTSSAALVNQVEKQRAQKSPVIRKNLNEQELDNIWDEKQLQILLESCPDYDQRRKIRARLRQIMAEHKACTDVVAQAGLTDNITSNGKNGELLKPMCNLNVKPIATAVDDSGTESGEEVNQKILVQVQGALANLESALPALDPLRRSSVVELLTKLQTSLKLSSSDQTGKPTPPPRKCWNRKAAVGRQDRHTVGVSSEELKDARRWLEENGYGETTAPAASTLVAAESARNTPRSYEVAAPKTFRPVKFVPPPPKRTNHLAEDCVIPEPSRHALQNCNSFSCPPAQHVIVEDLDCKRRKTSTATTISIRDSSESSTGGSSSPSSSSGDDDDDDSRSVSSAQRLLQIASNDHCRKFRLQGKRVKLKRGAAGERGRSSGDDDEYRSRCVPLIKEPPPATTSGGGVPLFEPKTANDKKYLAFLRQQAEADEKEATASAYNPLQGKLQGNWGNRFGRIKTTFERRIGGGGGGAKTTASAAVSPNRNVAKTFWHDICKCPSDDSIAYYRSKKFPSFKPDTAAAPTGQWSGENRGFSHGARSAFKPVQQQQFKQQQPQQFAPVKSVPRLDTSLLGPPQMVTYPKHLPLYNSSVTTAHRPFVYSDASDDPASPPGPQHDECAPQPATVVSRVMGSPQTATIVKSKQRPGGPSPSPSLKTTPAPVRQPPASSVKAFSAQHNNNHLPSPSGAAPKPPTRNPRVVTQQRSPTTSPVRMPSVLQKSESWHQMIVGQSRAAARSPLPHIPAAAPLRHASAPYEGYMHCKREIAQKQNIVRQHLHAGTESASACRRASPKLVKLNDDIDKVDDTFESLFKEATRPSK